MKIQKEVSRFAPQENISSYFCFDSYDAAKNVFDAEREKFDAMFANGMYQKAAINHPLGYMRYITRSGYFVMATDIIDTNLAIKELRKFGLEPYHVVVSDKNILELQREWI